MSQHSREICNCKYLSSRETFVTWQQSAAVHSCAARGPAASKQSCSVQQGPTRAHAPAFHKLSSFRQLVVYHKKMFHIHVGQLWSRRASYSWLEGGTRVKGGEKVTVCHPSFASAPVHPHFALRRNLFRHVLRYVIKHMLKLSNLRNFSFCCNL